MIVVLILGILLSIAGLSVRRARMRARYTQCIANLKRIQGAKEQWALERNRPANAVPTNADLYGTGSYIVVEPTCPVNGTYNLRPVSQPPTCTIGGIWPHRID
jgi:Tfp pilus assembly protein PilE